MHTEQDKYLDRVLYSYHFGRIPNDQYTRYLQCRMDVIQFLKNEFKYPEERVNEPSPIGPAERGTGINILWEFEILLIFCHGSKKRSGELKQKLLASLHQEFHTKGVTLTEERVLLSMLFLKGSSSVKVDIIPGVEPVQGSHLEDSPIEKGDFYFLFDDAKCQAAPINLQRQVQFLKRMGSQGNMPIRLLKIWNHYTGGSIESYAFELMAWEAGAEGKLGSFKSPTSLLYAVLDFMYPKLLNDEPFREIGSQAPCPDFLSPEEKLTLANKFSKILQVIKEEDMQELKKMFPLNPKYKG